MILETRVQLLHLEEYCAKDNHYPDVCVHSYYTFKEHDILVWGEGTPILTYSLIPRPKEEEKRRGFSRSRMCLIISSDVSISRQKCNGSPSWFYQ